MGDTPPPPPPGTRPARGEGMGGAGVPAGSPPGLGVQGVGGFLEGGGGCATGLAEKEHTPHPLRYGGRHPLGFPHAPLAQCHPPQASPPPPIVTHTPLPIQLAAPGKEGSPRHCSRPRRMKDAPPLHAGGHPPLQQSPPSDPGGSSLGGSPSLLWDTGQGRPVPPGNRCWRAAAITARFFPSSLFSLQFSNYLGNLYIYILSIYIISPAVPPPLPSGASRAVPRCSPKSSFYREFEDATTPSGETRVCVSPHPCVPRNRPAPRRWDGGMFPVGPGHRLGDRRCCSLRQCCPGGRAGWKFPI